MQSNASADRIIAPTLCGSVIPSKARIIGFKEIFLEILINLSREIVFENANCKLFTLSDYSSLLSEAVKINFISKDMISSLEEWRSSPSTWNN